MSRTVMVTLIYHRHKPIDPNLYIPQTLHKTTLFLQT
jgi:hypothetical protein